MNIEQILVLLALTAYAVYRQSVRHALSGKFAWGAWDYVHDAHPHGGFGEVMLMIAAMVAMQAEIVWRRALALPAGDAAGQGALRSA